MNNEEVYSMLCNLLYNLEDDLVLDLNNGEHGYKSYEASYKAVKKHTLRMLRKQIKRAKQRFDEEKDIEVAKGEPK